MAKRILMGTHSPARPTVDDPARLRLTCAQRFALATLHAAQQRGETAACGRQTGVHAGRFTLHWRVARKLITLGLAREHIFAGQRVAITASGEMLARRTFGRGAP